MLRNPAIRSTCRTGAAAVEFAFILPLLFLMILGIWELGRIIQVHQILAGAAREGARLAAQATIIMPNGANTQIKFNTGSPNVEDAIRDYLIGSGLTNLNNVSISFAFVEGSSGRPDPYLGQKNERFQIRISIPYVNVRWINLSLFNPSTISAEIYWQMLVDDPFTLNANLPGWNLQ